MYSAILQGCDPRDELELDGPDVAGVEQLQLEHVPCQNAAVCSGKSILAHLLYVQQEHLYGGNFYYRLKLLK